MKSNLSRTENEKTHTLISNNHTIDYSDYCRAWRYNLHNDHEHRRGEKRFPQMNRRDLTRMSDLERGGRRLSDRPLVVHYSSEHGE